MTGAEEQRVRSRKMAVGQHEHCDKCYNLHCQVSVQISVSCMVIQCHKNCGASLHMCKEDEHQLLCPNETVHCLNAHYGCPLTMQRHRLAKHLEVCPASVVSCSQEWNRWPISDTNQAFYRNVSENPQAKLDLDIAIALRDQELLFRSIKMKNIFPELMVEDSAPQATSAGVNSPAGEGACSVDYVEFAENGCSVIEEKELSKEERDALARSRDVENIHDYSSWERIFKKEMEGCKETVKNLRRLDEKVEEKEEQESQNCQRETRDSHQGQETAAAAPDMIGATDLAPWQDGVLERLGKEVDIAEYNMYMAHNGAMLINFGQLAACTPREKDFVYGNLEPVEIKTIRSFKVPKSYRVKRNYMKDPSVKAKPIHQSVDTADLGVSLEDLPKCDEVSATLLCSLEKELRGHLISQGSSTDGLYIDVGTQTYNFASAPFETDASLADVVADKAPGLQVNTEAESVTRRHNRSSSAFSYMCGRFFRRDEYCSHFRNVHSDIQASLNGWFQQRCPLAYLGCTFTQTRFHPSGHRGTIKYCQDVNTLVLQPEVAPSLLCESKNTFRNLGRNMDHLSSLPLEILQHIAGYLDSFTLSQLSQVSHLMRDVCATLLQERGMVSLKWEKKTYSHGGSSWRCRKKVWEFSFVFSAVDKWNFSDVRPVSDHLKACPFYQREERTQPTALACLGEVRDKLGEEEVKPRR